MRGMGRTVVLLEDDVIVGMVTKIRAKHGACTTRVLAHHLGTKVEWTYSRMVKLRDAGMLTWSTVTGSIRAVGSFEVVPTQLDPVLTPDGSGVEAEPDGEVVSGSPGDGASPAPAEDGGTGVAGGVGQLTSMGARKPVGNGDGKRGPRQGGGKVGH
jgi:hypothetical protein